jgi:L,D-transpeptidase catalytic domain
MVLSGCHGLERDRALDRIDGARLRLARLAPDASDSGRSAIDSARKALLEAEAVVRGTSFLSPWELLGGPSTWEPELQHGLDGVDIAEWVVERDRVQKVEEADDWLHAAEIAVDEARGSGGPKVQWSARARLRRAEAILDESRRWKESGNLELAAEKAREAANLAAELPNETRAMLARLGDPANLRRWEELVEFAVAESRRHGGSALVVDKGRQVAMLFTRGKPARLLPVELGYNGLSRKLRAGDGATPEGTYRVTRRKGKGETAYHRALLLSYPNDEDRVRFREARAQGEIERAATIGGLIEIHGEGGRGENWTDGCVALANSDMDYLFERLVPGSPVVIVGSYHDVSERWRRGSGERRE